MLTITSPIVAYATPSQSQCPSQNFNHFLTAFSTDLTLQSNFHQHFIRKLTLVKTADGFVPYQPMVDSRALHFPLMSPAKPTPGSAVVSPDGQSAVYTDKRAGLGNIKVYTFNHTNSCWLLSGIEDWSVRDSLLTLTATAGMSIAEQRCSARADIYSKLGSPERYPLTAEFYQAFMDYLVCAAASGDPQSSIAAAGLGQSGMAAFPGYAETERLYLAAAKTIPDAVGALASFYCDAGDASHTGPCLAPEKAQAVLEKAAATGSARGLHDLADAFETGQLIAQNLPRAMACYDEASKAGSTDAQTAINRLLSKGVKADGSVACL